MVAVGALLAAAEDEAAPEPVASATVAVGALALEPVAPVVDSGAIGFGSSGGMMSFSMYGKNVPTGNTRLVWISQGRARAHARAGQ